jgi:homoserine acetyltransferase
MRDYKEKLRAILDLNSYIVLTLACNYYRLIRNLTTLYEKLKVLKQKLEPTLNYLQQLAQAAYNRA